MVDRLAGGNLSKEGREEIKQSIFRTRFEQGSKHLGLFHVFVHFRMQSWFQMMQIDNGAMLKQLNDLVNEEG